MAHTALITGVGRRRGIAAGIAQGLAADGWNLALSCWRPYDERLGLEHGPDDPSDIADQLRTTTKVALLPADLGEPVAPGAFVSAARTTLGPLHALVLAHCESVDSTILDTTVESFDRHYAVNVRGSWLLLRAFAQQLPPDGGSVIALTSDTVGNVPYGATKAALDRMVLAAAHEFGGKNLRANVINPGPVDTGWMTDAVRNRASRSATDRQAGNIRRHRQPGAVPAVRAGMLDQRTADPQQRGFPTGRLPV
mgnify:CR=1 FL=1